jgi:hypothetical protein
MGIGVVLLLWAVFGTIVASVGAVVLGGTTAFLTRRVPRYRRSAILVACFFPFACFAWTGAVFMFQAFVNEGLLSRDPGLGDTWHCPLPNGYALMMIDLTDEGWVYNPKTQLVPDAVSDQDDAVPEVRTLQIAGRYILGGRSARRTMSSEEDGDKVNSYFLLDTTTGKYKTFSTYEQLRDAAAPQGVQPNLEPIYQVYSRYRFTWFDVLVGFLFCVPPLVLGSLLLRWVIRLRRERTIVS